MKLTFRKAYAGITALLLVVGIWLVSATYTSREPTPVGAIATVLGMIAVLVPTTGAIANYIARLVGIHFRFTRRDAFWLWMVLLVAYGWSIYANNPRYKVYKLGTANFEGMVLEDTSTGDMTPLGKVLTDEDLHGPKESSISN